MAAVTVLAVTVAHEKISIILKGYKCWSRLLHLKSVPTTTPSCKYRHEQELTTVWSTVSLRSINSILIKIIISEQITQKYGYTKNNENIVLTNKTVLV